MEKTYSTNVGIDVGLLKNRIDLTLDWYYTDTKDVLYNRPLPSAFGAYDAKNYYTMMSNIARMTNQGVEMTINSRNIVNGPFKWNSTINFAMNNEKSNPLIWELIFKSGSYRVESFPWRAKEHCLRV